MTERCMEANKNNLVKGGYECTFKLSECYSEKKPLKIGYFADGVWGHKALKKIIGDDEISVAFICVRFDSEDRMFLDFSEKYRIDYLKYKNINSVEFIEKIKKYDCDLFVSMSFNQIFKSEIIDVPRHGIINCHAGKLPFYRGRNVLNWALINDEKDFGITVHYVDEGIDTGALILQRSYVISDKDTYRTLLERAYTECADILYNSIDMFKCGIPASVKQENISSAGFYCSQRKCGDEVLNWNQGSREIFNFVRAICHPAPMARARLNGVDMKINKVELIENAPNYKGIIGAVLMKERNGCFLVKTKDSFIRVVDFEYNGNVKVGDRFEVR